MHRPDGYTASGREQPGAMSQTLNDILDTVEHVNWTTSIPGTGMGVSSTSGAPLATSTAAEPFAPPSRIPGAAAAGRGGWQATSGGSHHQHQMPPSPPAYAASSTSSSSGPPASAAGGGHFAVSATTSPSSVRVFSLPPTGSAVAPFPHHVGQSFGLFGGGGGSQTPSHGAPPPQYGEHHHVMIGGAPPSSAGALPTMLPLRPHHHHLFQQQPSTGGGGKHHQTLSSSTLHQRMPHGGNPHRSGGRGGGGGSGGRVVTASTAPTAQQPHGVSPHSAALAPAQRTPRRTNNGGSSSQGSLTPPPGGHDSQLASGNASFTGDSSASCVSSVPTVQRTTLDIADPRGLCLPPGALNAIPPPPPPPAAALETNPQRLAQRRKQILFGKVTEGYRHYAVAVPVGWRQRGNPLHPVTPRVDLICSKRRWDSDVGAWRRQLHQWDMALPSYEASLHPMDVSSDVGAPPPTIFGRAISEEEILLHREEAHRYLDDVKRVVRENNWSEEKEGAQLSSSAATTMTHEDGRTTDAGYATDHSSHATQCTSSERYPTVGRSSMLSMQNSSSQHFSHPRGVAGGSDHRSGVGGGHYGVGMGRGSTQYSEAVPSDNEDPLYGDFASYGAPHQQPPAQGGWRHTTPRSSGTHPVTAVNPAQGGGYIAPPPAYPTTLSSSGHFPAVGSAAHVDGHAAGRAGGMSTTMAFTASTHGNVGDLVRSSEPHATSAAVPDPIGPTSASTVAAFSGLSIAGAGGGPQPSSALWNTADDHHGGQHQTKAEPGTTTQPPHLPSRLAAAFLGGGGASSDPASSPTHLHHLNQSTSSAAASPGIGLPLSGGEGTGPLPRMVTIIAIRQVSKEARTSGDQPIFIGLDAVSDAQDVFNKLCHRFPGAAQCMQFHVDSEGPYAAAAAALQHPGAATPCDLHDHRHCLCVALDSAQAVEVLLSTSVPPALPEVLYYHDGPLFASMGTMDEDISSELAHTGAVGGQIRTPSGHLTTDPTKQLPLGDWLIARSLSRHELMQTPGVAGGQSGAASAAIAAASSGMCLLPSVLAASMTGMTSVAAAGGGISLAMAYPAVEQLTPTDRPESRYEGDRTHATHSPLRATAPSDSFVHRGPSA